MKFICFSEKVSLRVLHEQNKQKMLSGLTNDDVLMNKFEVKNDFLLNN